MHNSSHLNDANQDYLYPPANTYRYGYSIMKKAIFILLALFNATAHADEVFKCQLKSGRTVYQATPCQSAEKQQTIEIEKSDPRKVAEAEAKLKAWKEDFAKREEARIKAEQELKAEQDRKASIEALQKSAEYQQQQAYEAKRQADALERQNMQSPYLPQYFLLPRYQSPPAFPAFQSIPAYPSAIPHQHNVKESFFTDKHQSEHAKHGKDRDRDNETGHTKFIFKWQ